MEHFTNPPKRATFLVLKKILIILWLLSPLLLSGGGVFYLYFINTDISFEAAANFYLWDNTKDFYWVLWAYLNYSKHSLPDGYYFDFIKMSLLIGTFLFYARTNVGYLMDTGYSIEAGWLAITVNFTLLWGIMVYKLCKLYFDLFPKKYI